MNSTQAQAVADSDRDGDAPSQKSLRTRIALAFGLSDSTRITRLLNAFGYGSESGR